MSSYDIVIIGSGPGGYIAAIRASKAGKKVAVVEERDLGGTCLHRGCIPSKTMLQHAEVLHQVENAAAWGIQTGETTFSFEKMLKRKEKIVSQLQNGISSLLKQGKIDVIQGLGQVTHPEEVVVDTSSGEKRLQTKKVIVATGTNPIIPPVKGLEDIHFDTSDSIFNLQELPSSLLIVGGGIVGVEYASLFSSLHVEVTIVEMNEDIIVEEDPDAAAILRQSLERQGVSIFTNTTLENVEENQGKITASYKNNDGESGQVLTDHVLIAAGRKPNVTALQNSSVAYEAGFIKVDENMQTNIPGIYTIGDLASGGWKLAHAASAEGITAAEHASGIQPTINKNLIPRCIYTSPEIAAVGLTEKEAKQQGYNYKIETVPFQGNGKAMAMGETEGLTKIIIDKKFGEILGVMLIGPHVTEMIGEPTAFMHLEGTVEELAAMVHPHPTLSENLFEAANAWLEKGIHH
ncbi:dihydrolipoyl dehydrogenase [Salibacterium salarium]|uniref:Dihydrolipoyl dehydrogenase n=1 Tax=Salibacterium salarium TaxID=284579 RepID=A0A428MXH3_9BACI|nr:dihydrolipoyl dehydrogenase [Salibacterium salarium]RSL30853.1 dihydrolipoyl dehydrogenase [Salibacterium salarium]